MADGSGPEGPRNKKGRPFGSGTTNAKRRELRKEKQWSALEGQDPSSPSCLMKHLEALEKAKEKCQAKLKEQLQEAIDGVGTSSSASSSNPPQKKQKSLEKDTASKEEKQRQVVLEKPGKNGFRRATLTPAEKVLEKTQQEEEEWVEVPEEVEEEVVVPKAKVLEKTKVHNMPKAKDLEKSSGRPLVVVDWHNTLEVNNDVPGRNAYALTLLLQRADVLILSYTGGPTRMASWRPWYVGEKQVSLERLISPVPERQLQSLMIASQFSRKQSTGAYSPLPFKQNGKSTSG